MCLEYSQILQTALCNHGIQTGYLPTHENHPCVKWVSDNILHWNWVHDLALCLNEEYKFRYDKQEDHKAIKVLVRVVELVANNPYLLEKHEWKDPPLVMPEQYKCNDPVEAYRRYYREDKLQNVEVRYTNRETPPFLRTQD